MMRDYYQVFQRIYSRSFPNRYSSYMSTREREGSYRQRLERRSRPYLYRPFYAMSMPMLGRGGIAATGYGQSASSYVV